jgi:tRNA pseudouridine32 synthase/23S rRNA pseudouridine746 synthase
MFADGSPIARTTPYRHGETVLYRREVEDEPPADESETILFRNDRFLVADKPHGMPVTPGGDYLDRSLLVRLQKQMRNHSLVPAHRLDRDTAGLVLFVTDPAFRGAYHQLFAEGVVGREYIATAHLPSPPLKRQWRVGNRLGTGTPWFRRRVVSGAPNAVTEIEMVETRRHLGVFRIRPQTGKKHQIRVHMAGIGYPILGDRLYPDLVAKPTGPGPLQLLARRLEFTDPVSGRRRVFVSHRALASLEME